MSEILVGVSGSIAAYKAADLVSRLRKHDHGVRVVMTEGASRFVTPLTFQALSGNPVEDSLWRIDTANRPEHIDLADRTDLMVIAPTTANVIAKIAAGIADEILTATVLVVATTTPVLIAPAMNTRMWENPITQRNLGALRDLGYRVIEPDAGRLACGDVGPGRMAEPEAIVERVEEILSGMPTDAG